MSLWRKKSCNTLAKVGSAMRHLLVLFEAARRQCHELGNGREIPIGVYDLAMPEVRGQLADPAVDIFAIAIPLQ
jgi:hypothetical protein